MRNITIFDKPYPFEKQAEGFAIMTAVVEKKCDECPVLTECSTNEHFVMPEDTFCMKKKAQMLERLMNNG